MSNERWEFTGETKVFSGITLKRIRAAVGFRLKCGIAISKGELGGWIEKESNLSGDAWVYDDARVYGNARVSGDAWVYGKADVSGDAKVYGKAGVSGDAWVYGNARVYDDAWVYGKADVSGDARVYGNAGVSGDAWVFGKARVYDDALVSGNARVFGDARVSGKAEVSGKADVFGIRDYAVFKNVWSSGRWFTYTRSDRMWTVGCFRGTGEELIAKAYKDSEKSGRCYEAVVKAQEAIEKAMEE